MKKTLVSLAVTSLLAANTGFAMDIGKEKMNQAGDVVGDNQSSFNDVDYPANGVFVQLQYGMGHVKTTPSTGEFDTLNNYKMTPSSNSEKSTEYGVQLGYEHSDIQNRFLKFLRVERESIALEVDHQSKVSQDGNISLSGNPPMYAYTTDLKASNRLMLDGKVNLFKLWHFSPYISAGVGMGQYQASYSAVSAYEDVSPSFTSNTVKKTKMVYQYGTGIDWFVSKGFSMSLGYEYVDAGKLSMPSDPSTGPETAPSLSLKSQEIVLGINVTF